MKPLRNVFVAAITLIRANIWSWGVGLTYADWMQLAHTEDEDEEAVTNETVKCYSYALAIVELCCGKCI